MENKTLYTDSHGQSFEFGISQHHTNICVNMSGGADSALLLYMTLKYCEKHIPNAKVYILTCSNQQTGWYNAKWAATALNRVLEISRSKLIAGHLTYFAETQDRNEINHYERIVQHQFGCTLFLHGTTQNPPQDIEHLLEGRFVQRDPGNTMLISKTNYIDNLPATERYIPFIKVDKRMVVYLYELFGLTNTLLGYTRSCEEKTWMNNDSPWMTSHCGECWWCKERKWAFNQ